MLAIVGSGASAEFWTWFSRLGSVAGILALMPKRLRESAFPALRASWHGIALLAALGYLMLAGTVLRRVIPGPVLLATVTPVAVYYLVNRILLTRALKEHFRQFAKKSH